MIFHWNEMHLEKIIKLEIVYHGTSIARTNIRMEFYDIS